MMQMMGTELTGVIADHIAAVNLFDTDAVVATFVFPRVEAPRGAHSDLISGGRR
jgi:hypothetical protein